MIAFCLGAGWVGSYLQKYIPTHVNGGPHSKSYHRKLPTSAVSLTGQPQIPKTRLVLQLFFAQSVEARC